MKLSELEPNFVSIVDPGRTYQNVEAIEHAHGVMFTCPLCTGHMVLCWFRDRGVPDDETPRPGRWAASGTGLSDLTLSPSVHLSGPGCGWHGFVTNGEVTTC